MSSPMPSSSTLIQPGSQPEYGSRPKTEARAMMGGLGDGENSSLLEEQPAQRRSKRGRERQLELLDRALEETFGSGKYQRRLLAVSAFSIFVDASEGALSPMLYVEFQREWGVALNELAVIGASSSAGLMMGSLLVGLLADRFGRATGFVWSLVAVALFGYISSMAVNVATFAASRFFVGVAAGGNFVTSSALLFEAVPKPVRGRYVMMTGIAFGVTHLLTVGIAWAFFPTIGWRWAIRILALLALPVLYIFRDVRETPRFHVVSSRFEEAVDTVRHIASENGVPNPLFLSAKELRQCQSDQQQHSGAALGRQSTYNAMLEAFSSKKLRVLAPLVAVWFLVAFSNGIVQFLPLEIEKFTGKFNVQFIVGIVLSLSALLATAINVTVVDRVGRRVVICVGCCVASVSTYSLRLDDNTATFLTSVFLLHCAICVVTATLYLFTPESFPTQIRGTMFGICVVVSRVASITAPILFGSLDHDSLADKSAIFGSFALLAAVMSCALVNTKRYS